MRSSPKPTPESWLQIIRQAYELFDDAKARGFGDPPFSLGGGTVLMLRFKHRLSKDIDLFGYDAQWLSVFSPRLNDLAASLAESYTELANTIKIVTSSGDIDFIIAADVAAPVTRNLESIAGRPMAVDPISEILAKKLFYRAATFKVRDIYDLSAAIDLAPHDATAAMQAALSKRDILLRRLDQLKDISHQDLASEIIGFEGALQHSRGMVEKVRSFVLALRSGANVEISDVAARRATPTRNKNQDIDR